jgi:hypothetical protein
MRVTFLLLQLAATRAMIRIAAAEVSGRDFIVVPPVGPSHLLFVAGAEFRAGSRALSPDRPFAHLS